MRAARAAASLARLGAWLGACLAASGGCSFERLPVVPDAAIDAAIEAPAPPACVNDPSYTPHPQTGHRYKAHPQPVNYDDAFDRCAADGAHLAVADTMAEVAHLATFTTTGGEVWIGFDDLNVEGQFAWNTGVVGYSAFPLGEPNNTNNEDCAAIRTSGAWHDQGCESMKRPLCECDPDYRAPRTPACRITAPPDSFEKSGRRVFRGPRATWFDAKAACEALGAHLIVIGDAAENMEIDPDLATAHWLGLTDLATEGTFVWTTGSPAEYRNWPGGTAPMDVVRDCAVLQDGGLWMNVDCEERYPYACECDPLPP